MKLDIFATMMPKLSQIKNTSCLFALAVFVSTFAVFHGDTTLEHKFFAIFCRGIYYGGIATVFLLVAYRMLHNKHIRDGNFWALVAFIAYWLNAHLNIYEEMPSLMGIDLLSVACIGMMTKNQMAKAFSFARFLLMLSALAGVISYVSLLVGGPLHPTIVPYYSLDESGMYMDYSISYILVRDTSARLCGLFNEPGAMGTYAGLFLCADNLRLKKPINAIIFLGGVLSWSLAFFLIIISYLILQSSKKPKVFFMIMIMIPILLYLPGHITTGVRNVDILIHRMDIIGGKLQGDNRNSEKYISFWDDYLQSSDVVMGLGNGFSKTIDTQSGNASIRMYIIDYGVLGTACMLGLLFYAGLCFCKHKGIYRTQPVLFLLCYFLSAYQRPYIFNGWYFLILFGGLAYIFRNIGEKMHDSKLILKS